MLGGPGDNAALIRPRFRCSLLSDRKYRLFGLSATRLAPEVNREIRDLIRQMSVANPLWGAPRIHGEMLKLGIKVSQATVGRHMVRRHGPPSPTWRTFLSNQVDGIAAIDMFVVVTAAFRLLYVSVILGHARRKILHLNVTQLGDYRERGRNPARKTRRLTSAIAGRDRLGNVDGLAVESAGEKSRMVVG